MHKRNLRHSVLNYCKIVCVLRCVFFYFDVYIHYAVQSLTLYTLCSRETVKSGSVCVHTFVRRWRLIGNIGSLDGQRGVAGVGGVWLGCGLRYGVPRRRRRLDGKLGHSMVLH